MNKKKITITLAGALVIASAVFGAAPESARKLVDEGRFEEAVTALRKAVKSRPRDAESNYLLGYALLQNGNDTEAYTYLGKAENLGSLAAARLLAVNTFEAYEPDEARKHFDAWETAARKAKTSLPDEYDNINARLVAMSNMLRRIENIEIIDTLRVDSAAFFSHYKLSSHAGSLVSGDALTNVDGASVIFIPETRSEMLLAAPDSTGRTDIYSAVILDDGTMEQPVPAELNGEGHASFPFLMPDGVTLYYASTDGPDNLGGYDIYMTRRNGEGGFMQSQNIGMPYNSPYNDFMLAIDETTGLGWWASDREQIPGTVTIYVYAPSETRVNHDADSENIASLARLSDISLTRKADKDYKKILENSLSKIGGGEQVADISPKFELDMGKRGIYTSLDNFRNQDARRAMLQYLTDGVKLRKDMETLASLREQYSLSHSEALARQILELEPEIERRRLEMRAARNNVVRLENGGR